jgi:hypothetical protein
MTRVIARAYRHPANGMDGDSMKRRHWAITLTTAIALTGAVVMPASALSATTAAAPPVATKGCSGYKYAGNQARDLANEGVYGDIRAVGAKYGGTSGNHMAVWLGSNTAEHADPSSPVFGEDWVQGGYVTGRIDAFTEKSTVLYAEATGPGYGPTGKMFPQYKVDNRFFASEMTTTTKDKGKYGLYYMFTGSTLIDSSWLINRTNTDSVAVIESYGTGQPGLACPSISDGLFGTTGSNNHYNSGTILFDIKHGFVSYRWQTDIPTNTLHNAPYHSHYWSKYDAFQADGS